MAPIFLEPEQPLKYENYRIEMRWYRTGVIPCDILVPHIDSRVKIIENERPGASPCGACDTETVKRRVYWESGYVVGFLHKIGINICNLT